MYFYYCTLLSCHLFTVCNISISKYCFIVIKKNKNGLSHIKCLTRFLRIFPKSTRKGIQSGEDMCTLRNWDTEGQIHSLYLRHAHTHLILGCQIVNQRKKLMWIVSAEWVRIEYFSSEVCCTLMVFFLFIPRCILEDWVLHTA